MENSGLASVLIVVHNHEKYLKPCINSVLRQDYPCEVILVDNCSIDNSLKVAKEEFPNIKIIESVENKGYGAGNNIGFKHAEGKYIVFLNPDTIVEERWLRELIRPLQNEEKVITTPKILLYDGSSINTCGMIDHFTGLTFTRGIGSKNDAFTELEEVSGFSGACFAIRKDYFEELGGFDENFFLYNEDADLSWRAHLKGFNVLYVPSSVVKHDYKLNVPPKKIYHLEKGRYMILKKYLSCKYFLLLSLSLLTTEFLTFGYSSKLGWEGVKYKLKAVIERFTIRVNKVEGDKENLLKNLSVTIPTNQLTSNKLEEAIIKFANKIYKWNIKWVR